MGVGKTNEPTVLRVGPRFHQPAVGVSQGGTVEETEDARILEASQNQYVFALGRVARLAPLPVLFQAARQHQGAQFGQRFFPAVQIRQVGINFRVGHRVRLKGVRLLLCVTKVRDSVEKRWTGYECSELEAAGKR